MKVVTIGVYGFEEEEFFHTLADAGVDTFCDLRRRRGMRGSTYAFANSTYLQQRLASAGIRYLHMKELAPPQHIRDIQKQADTTARLRKRDRLALSDEFVSAYIASCLSTFDSTTFASQLDGAKVVALFCVEREPKACHRSIVADQISTDLGITVEHLRP